MRLADTCSSSEHSLYYLTNIYIYINIYTHINLISIHIYAILISIKYNKI